MTMEAIDTTIEILGKPYQIKCPQSEVTALQQAARYFEEQMQLLRESGKVLSADRIMTITALNITHQFLQLENQLQAYTQTTQHRLKEIQTRVEAALAQNAQMELTTIEEI